MRRRVLALYLLCVLGGATCVTAGIWWIAGAILLFLAVGVAFDLDRLHREHIETALTLSASSSVGQLRNRLAHERRQRMRHR